MLIGIAVVASSSPRPPWVLALQALGAATAMAGIVLLDQSRLERP